MSEQVHKILLACDGLNRTGQEAPASHGKEALINKVVQLTEDELDVFIYLATKELNPQVDLTRQHVCHP